MTETFINKGIFTLSINLLILVTGWFTLPYIANEFIPSIEIPAVAVVIPAPFMPQENIKQNIVSKVERAFMRTGEIINVEGRIDDGKAVIIVFYKWDFSPEEALRKARQVVDNIQLPKESLAPIFVLHRPSNNPIFRVALYGPSVQQVSMAARQLSSKMERVRGVAQVILSGEVPTTSTVSVRPSEMAAAGMNSGDIVKSAKQFWNLNLFIPGKETNILLSNKIDSLDKVQQLPVVNQAGKSMPLGHFAKISSDTGLPKVFMNGESPAVIIEVLKGAGADTLFIVEQLEGLLQNFRDNPQLSQGITQKVIYDEGAKIREGQDSVFQNFYAGVALNSLILMIFLGSPIGVLVASVVFPTSLLGSLIAMKYFGISINLFSLNGFSLAVGMITDSATVILESITRRVQNGEELFRSCVRGVKDVSLGIVASTLSSAGVLLPIAMQKNITSKLFSDLALTVVSTQILSLIAVFSLVPWLCYKVLGKKSVSLSNPFMRTFLSLGPFIVNTSIRFTSKIHLYCRSKPKRQLLYSIATVVFSISLLALMPKTEFLPMVSSRVYSLDYPVDKNSMELKGPKDLRLLAKTLASWSDSTWSVTKMGGQGVEALFELKNSLPLKELEKRLSQLPLKKERLHVLPVGPAPTGESMGYDGLLFISDQLPVEKRKIFTAQLCQNVQISECLEQDFYSMSEQTLAPDHLLTHALGSNEIEALSQIVIPLHKIDLADLGRLDLTNPLNLAIDFDGPLLNLPLQVKKHGLALLGDLYTVSTKQTYTLLNSLNDESFGVLYFKMKNATLGEIDTIISAIGKKLNIASGMIRPQGGMATMNESFSSMLMALSLSGLIVFFVLFLQFKSVIQAVLIMSTIPLALGGAIIGLLIMGETMNASVMVGLILLVGIIVNNGIFLVESTNQKLAAGESNADAISNSVIERTRPILMTSFATIFGMLPTLLVGGEGSELYRGMAVVNVFGMLTGTFFSLAVTPMTIEYFLPKQVEQVEKNKELKHESINVVV